MSTSKMVLHILGVCISMLVFVLVVVGLMRLGTVAYDTGYRVFTEQPMEKEPGTDVVIEVSKGMSDMELGTALEEKGLVKDAYLFAIQMKLSVYANKVKPGLYTLNTSQTAREMLQIMAAETESKDEETTE